VLVLVFGFVAARSPRHGYPLEAFVTYYCGGAAVMARTDPYANAFVSRCEQANEPGLLPVGVAEPAVLPPAVLAAFALLALLPYHLAGLLFLLLSLGALLGAAWAVARVTGLHAAVPFGAFAFMCGFVNLFYGEVVPIVLFGICFAGWALSRARFSLAAAGLAIALIEPQVAVPAALTAFAFERRMRLPLAIVAAVLLGASLVLGPQSLWHYTRDVLPVHAWSEISAADQYSSTWIAHWLGASDRTALDIGSAFSMLGWLAGLVVGGRVASRLREPAALVYVPVAFAVVAPLFVHDLQLPLAIPAGLLLARRGRYAGIAWAGVVLSAFPWVPGWFWRPTYPLLLLAVLGLALGAVVSRRNRVAFAAALIAVYTVVDRLLARAHGVVASSDAVEPVPIGADPALASVAWGRYVWAGAPSREITLGMLGGKLLSFAGPIAVAGAALLEAYRPLPQRPADGAAVAAGAAGVAAAADGAPVAAADVA
jgi:hypothetical protein